MAHTTKDKKKLLSRIRRIKGQTEAIERKANDRHGYALLGLDDRNVRVMVLDRDRRNAVPCRCRTCDVRAVHVRVQVVCNGLHRARRRIQEFLDRRVQRIAVCGSNEVTMRCRPKHPPAIDQAGSILQVRPAGQHARGRSYR